MLRGRDFDLKRFLPDEEVSGITTFSGMEGVYRMFPLQLASWIISSRRVFTISENLMLRFLAASYSKYKWSDLLWPFDSFAIDFETPLVFKDGAQDNIEISLILVSSFYNVCGDNVISDKDGFEVSSFATSINDRRRTSEFLSSREREILDNNVRHKRWRKVNNRIRQLGERISDLTSLPAGNNDPYTIQKNDYILDTSSFAKIIAGLCLYMEALPVGTVDAYQWLQTKHARSKRDARKIITDGENICRVEDFNVLSPETMNLFPEALGKGPAYTVTPHWRRAHYRRRRGQGKNPNAPRDIYVGPTLVHKDQIPDGAVPGGARSTVK
jgi:hypothetical protein